ncbi:MAG: hypothetical protein IT209_00575 [Armatimonadetes bacterium]|nr:hypothetical protein [Armatimonadota bacterium]
MALLIVNIAVLVLALLVLAVTVLRYRRLTPRIDRLFEEDGYELTSKGQKVSEESTDE